MLCRHQRHKGAIALPSIESGVHSSVEPAVEIEAAPIHGVGHAQITAHGEAADAADRGA
jgi:hypothetical protein